MAAGSYGQYDVDHARNVAVIGSDIAETLFPFVDPIGKTMVIDDRPFEVIGIGTKQGSVLGQSRDNWAIIPLTLASENVRAAPFRNHLCKSAGREACFGG